MQKLIIISILLTTCLFVAKTKNNDDCNIYRIGIEKLAISFSNDTIIFILNHTNNFNQEELMLSLSKDLKSRENDSNSILVNNNVYVSNDSILNCQFTITNFKFTDEYPAELFFNENFNGKIPSYIISSNILYFEKKYAYIRYFLISKFGGNMTFWYIFKKNKNDEWCVFRNGVYI